MIFAAGCILVSVPTYFYPELYDVFGGEKLVYYPWQLVTHFLQHGSYMGPLPLLLHLICNLMVVMTFGVISEKVLGAKRFFIIIIASLFIAQFFRLTLGVWGNGASSITWAFGPIAFLCILNMNRKDRAKLLKDFMFYVCIFIFLVIWVLITAVNIANGWFYSNLFHLIATIVGIVFALTWRGYIAKRVDVILDYDLAEKPMYDLWDKRIIGLSFLVPICITIILILSLSGILTKHVSRVRIVGIYPQSGPIDVINRANNQIIIKFSKPMKKEINHSSFNFYSNDGTPPISRDLVWVDDMTLYIKLSRQIYQGEKVKVLLRGFVDLDNRRFHDEIRLEYGF